MKKDEQRTSNKNLIDAFENAFCGISYAIKTQLNIKIQIIAGIVAVIAGIYFKLNKIEWLFLIFACALVFITEMLNTAIEETVNLSTKKYHPIAKIAKDVGAGAATLAAINSIIIGCILFLDKIF